MRDDNSNINNLNIPPSESSSFTFDWVTVFQLVTPIALGYVYNKGRKEKADLEDQLKKEIALREEKESEFKLKLQQVHVFNREGFRKEIAEITREEEERARQTLKKLYHVENSIKQILDIQCSPFKSRKEREEIESHLLRLSGSEPFESLRMRDGLNQIFVHDEQHCGGGFSGNGQIYRVWMKLWREKVQHEKNARITARKDELYVNKQKGK